MRTRRTGQVDLDNAILELQPVDYDEPVFVISFKCASIGYMNRISAIIFRHLGGYLVCSQTLKSIEDNSLGTRTM